MERQPQADAEMNWWKDIIMGQEADVLDSLWEENWRGLKSRFPDEEHDFYGLTDAEQDEVWQMMEEKAKDKMADIGDGLRKRYRETT